MTDLGNSFDEFVHWLRNQGLESVLIILAAILAHRAINKVARMWTRRLDARFRSTDDVVRSEESKHQHSLVQVVAYITIAFVYITAATRVLDVLKYPITALVAPATVIGAALGFGAQRIVQDFLAGFFLITERQYGYGDLVSIAVNSGGPNASGTVEDITLRVTKLRTLDGEVVTIPNGQIVKSINQSRDWARSIIDVPVPNTSDLTKVDAALHRVVDEVGSDPDIEPFIFDKPTVMGVEKIAPTYTTIRMLVRTLPGKQWEVGRRIRAVILRVFRESEVSLEPEALAALRAGIPMPGVDEEVSQ